MSIEQEIQDLTQSTTDLLNAVNTKKVTLDNSVSQAQTAVTDATSQVALAAAEKVGAQTARDEAETHKNQAYTYSQSAASAVAYQDLTAIAQTKAETAVDVFVYDTSKDSDGGAWRKRTQHTSWYNETLNTATRGSRKEFPAVAVIVAESNKVTIYDGDDPGMPMWMVFNALSSSSAIRTECQTVTMLNGIMVVGDGLNQGAIEVKMIEDVIKLHHSANDARVFYKGNIAERNDAKSFNYGTSLWESIVNPNINDVAMTVLPDAPIDPATGLPIPTIAVATDGGVSVIKDDGTVVDITLSSQFSYIRYVGFTDNNRLHFVGSYQSLANANFNHIVDIPTVDTLNAPYDNNISSLNGEFYFRKTATVTTADLFLLEPDNATGILSAQAWAKDAISSNKGLNKLYRNEETPTEGMISYITSTYNTGWMNGDIKLATLSDTDDTDLVGSELVTNGTFDVNFVGWSSVSQSSTLSIDNGRLKAVKTGSSSTWMARGVDVLTTETGKQYFIKADIDIDASNSTTNEAKLTLWDDRTNTAYGTYNVATIAQGVTFTAKSDGYVQPILVEALNAVIGDIFYIDNVSCVELESDRSVNAKGLQVFGTVQKNPVATGADLVAYSGFDASNYLQQPYNPDLDFGTGDFCIMGWVNSPLSNVNKHFFSISNGQGGGFGTNGQVTVKYDGPTNKMQFISSNATPISCDPFSENVWAHICLVRRDGILYAYQNGVLRGTTTNTSTLGATTTDSKVYIGVAVYNGVIQPNGSSKQALWRISGTAPTAEQIKKIYEDEKVLFQENAQATLYGTSDAVTALAYDDTTELLHVGTSGGRSVFQGLRRVDNTTDAVGTAISASNGLIVEE